MSTISIADLHPHGSDLFTDSESYLKDLNEAENLVKGGIDTQTIITDDVISTYACSNCISHITNTSFIPK